MKFAGEPCATLLSSNPGRNHRKDHKRSSLARGGDSSSERRNGEKHYPPKPSPAPSDIYTYTAGLDGKYVEAVNLPFAGANACGAAL